MTRQAIPSEVLFALLKALDPSRILRGRFTAKKGETDERSKRAFISLIEAARDSSSARQFEKKAAASEGVAKNAAGGGHGAITSLIVTYDGDQVRIDIDYEDGYSYTGGYTWS